MGRLSALTTPTLTVCDRPNGLPMAMTQSPGCICAESPNFASGSAWSGFSVSSMQRAVGERVASHHARAIPDVVFLAVQRDLHLVGALHDVVVGEDEAFLG